MTALPKTGLKIPADVMPIVEQLRMRAGYSDCPALAAADLIEAQAARIADLEAERARTVEEYHEDYGFVTWWCWRDSAWLGEPAWIGSPLCEDWPGYHTHWTPHPKFPRALASEKGGQADG